MSMTAQTGAQPNYLRPDFKEYDPTNLSVYEYMMRDVQEYLDLPAISFYGVKTDYRYLLERIERAERAFRAHGISKGDIVAVSLPGMPEAIHIIYALNKIGAIYCAFDCRCKEDEVLEMLEKFQPKLCIIPNFQLKAFRNVHDTTVVYAAPANSLGPFKLTGDIADLFKGRSFLIAAHKNMVSYNAYMKWESRGENLPPEKNEGNVFGYFYTSGTTYGRKSIILTNENVNAAVRQYTGTEDYVKRGESMLDIMPMFTCYGVTIAMHLPLSLGVHVKLIPLLKPKQMKRTLLREKPNFIITVPAHWEYFVKDKFDGCDLSFLTTVVVGGDKVDPAYEDKINEIFKSCGSKAWLRVGYGLSETNAVGACPVPGKPKGSVGLPMEYTLMGIFDRDTLQPMPAGEKGEICIWGPTVCQGYYKDEEMTAQLLRLHDDGRVWLHTGDVGYMDEQGYLFFCERIKRMYVRHDGTKVSPYSIEQILEKCPEIGRCMITAIRDTDHTHGMCARALVVLKEGVKPSEGRSAVHRYIKEHLGIHMIPKEVLFVEKLPYTKNGKLDYFAASQLENN